MLIAAELVIRVARRARIELSPRPDRLALAPPAPASKRAGRSLLERFSIEWVPVSAREFAVEVLSTLPGWPGAA